MRHCEMASWVCLAKLALVHSENGLSDGHDGHSDARKELSDAHDAPGLQPVHGALDRLVLSAGASAASWSVFERRRSMMRPSSVKVRLAQSSPCARAAAAHARPRSTPANRRSTGESYSASSAAGSLRLNHCCTK